MSIMFTIVSIFVFIGVLIPYIQADIGVSQTSSSADDLVDTIGQESSISSINAFDIIGSVFKMFFWTFGDLPFYIDLIFVPLRIILALVIARNIWVGGGA